ncbi:MAG: hypothetical protein V4556_00125 [Bacteroidota bacterium]
MNKKLLKTIFSVKYYVLFCTIFFNFTNAYSQKENFNCEIFKLILKGIEKQKEKLEVYKFIKDSIYITADSEGMNPRIVNNSHIPDKIVDSLVKISDFLSITNDSLYYFKAQNVVIDTFNFFTNNCDCINNGNMFLFENNKVLETNFFAPNLIEIKGISLKDNQLVINLSDRKSKFSVYFYFDIVLSKPLLSKIRSAYIELN